jgi:hypothetical protein
VDTEQQRRRDGEIARHRWQNPPMSFRSISERLGMSVGSVQKVKKRQEKLDQEKSNELDSVSAKYDGDGLAAEDVQTAADCERLNDLELHRLLKLPAGSKGSGRAKPILVVIAAIVVLVSAGITGYLVINGHRHPASPSPSASPFATETPSAPASPSGPRPTVLSFTGLKTPEGVAVDTAGNVYVADHGNRVVRWSAGSSTQTVLSFTGLNHPGGVAVDIAGDVYVADWGNNRVLRWAAGSTTQTELPFTGLNHPQGVVVDTVGDVYVTDYYNNRVVKWAAVSNTQTVLALTGLSKPLDVAVDTARNLYVTFNANNRVLKLPTQ